MTTDEALKLANEALAEHTTHTARPALYEALIHAWYREPLLAQAVLDLVARLTGPSGEWAQLQMQNATIASLEQRLAKALARIAELEACNQETEAMLIAIVRNYANADVRAQKAEQQLLKGGV